MNNKPKVTVKPYPEDWKIPGFQWSVVFPDGNAVTSGAETRKGAQNAARNYIKDYLATRRP